MKPSVKRNLKAHFQEVSGTLFQDEIKNNLDKKMLAESMGIIDEFSNVLYRLGEKYKVSEIKVEKP